jgi:hypothetical protein
MSRDGSGIRSMGISFIYFPGRIPFSHNSHSLYTKSWVPELDAKFTSNKRRVLEERNKMYVPGKWEV